MSALSACTGATPRCHLRLRPAGRPPPVSTSATAKRKHRGLLRSLYRLLAPVSRECQAEAHHQVAAGALQLAVRHRAHVADRMPDIGSPHVLWSSHTADAAHAGQHVPVTVAGLTRPLRPGPCLGNTGPGLSRSETRSRGVSWGFAVGSVAWLAPSRRAAVACLWPGRQAGGNCSASLTGRVTVTVGAGTTAEASSGLPRRGLSCSCQAIPSTASLSHAALRGGSLGDRAAALRRPRCTATARHPIAIIRSDAPPR